MLNCAIMDIFMNTDKLYHYGTLINCAITDIFMNTDKLYHYETPINYAIMDMFMNTMQLFGLWILKTHRSNNATRIFMKFGNVYEQLDNMHISIPEHSYQYD